MSKNRFELIKKIGQGSFGIVYKAKDTTTNQFVAVKIESEGSDRLHLENKLYIDLNNYKNEFIPKLIWFGKKSNHNLVVMEFLGPSLSKLHNYCGNKFSTITVCLIAIECIRIMEFIHNHGIIHRDIKPDNFTVGYGNKNKQVYIIDFGLSKRYINTETYSHIGYSNDKGFTGSYRYSSMRNHKGVELSRRDDMESVCNMLIYFLKSRLPWQGVSASTKSKKNYEIYKKKRDLPISDLCKDIPVEFAKFMKYSRELKFSEKPDYQYLVNLMEHCLERENYDGNKIFDWNVKLDRQSKEKMDK